MSEPDEAHRPRESGGRPDADETSPREEARPGEGGPWTPVVYGRTRRADRWWRAVPRDVDREWLAAVVTGLTAGGRDLDQGPRFLLAQNRRNRLVGVACRAAEISTSMNSDGSRPLYCFVGWCAPLAGAAGGGPVLAELQDRYVPWASPVYEKWMRADWETHPSRLHQPHEPPPGPPPWGTAPARTAPLRPEPEHPLHWPAADADIPWRIARDSGSPCAVSLGWRRARDAQALTGVRSDIAADDVREVVKAGRPAPPPAPPSRPPPASASPAKQAGPRTGDGPSGGSSPGRPGNPPVVPRALRPSADGSGKPPAVPQDPRVPRKEASPGWSPLSKTWEWGRRKMKRLVSPSDGQDTAQGRRGEGRSGRGQGG
ncbi:hypothetical protein [Streptomyces spectabilis]|uniref:Uncharacterized protein n=1 Tax=Streptomyces spectabilis TaxID=68270 RepID=A0A7W8APL6_STRST|nr:hypothetical protein [Streptomyces spectabilis]MBB5102285.1 hypothetical protein [Streptomyces spectabilis]MCI3907333.1 hypothetical protein [Streptomyces spectabilis]GGV29881.1 hypothetical protein GCM10010245_48590 [Streptomyces spectabilis]